MRLLSRGLAGALFTIAPSAGADVLYDSLYIVDQGLQDGGVGNAIGGWDPFPSLGTVDSQVADDFTIDRPHTITKIVRDYQSHNGTTPAEGVWVQFYADDNGVPAEEVYAEYIVTPENVNAINLGQIIGFQAWRLELDLTAANITLPEGPWWIDVQPLDINASGDWFWSIRSILTLIDGPIHVRDGWAAHGNSYYGLWNSSTWIPLNFRGNGSLSMRVEGDPGAAVILGLEGSCPGEVTALVSGATPGGSVAFAASFGEGAFIIPNNLACGGAELGLSGNGIRLVGAVNADANGDASLIGNVPAAGCGRVFVQAIDIDSCVTSNVSEL